MYPERLSNDVYLNLASPFRIFHDSITWDVVVHWHEFYEVAFVLSGRGTHILNGVAHPLVGGAAFLLTPTDFHALEPDLRAGPLELYNLIFSEALLTDELRALVFDGCKSYHVVFSGEERDALGERFETIWNEAQGSAAGQSLMIRSSLEQILVLLARHRTPDADPRAAMGHPAVQAALIYIDHHFREPLSLKCLAEQVHLAPGYLSELFQRSTGKPFQVYLQDVRLRFALSLLQSSSVSVTEVCYISGFGNLSHFTRAFKKKFGYSPRESRCPRSEMAEGIERRAEADTV